MLKRKIIVLSAVATIILLFSQKAFSQQAWATNFWGTAQVHGVNVTSSDVIKAYDSGGQLCGTTNGNSGYYSIYVSGDIAGTDTDEGSPAGGTITFKINDETAVVVSGSNTAGYNAPSTVRCDINIPSDHHDITIQTEMVGLAFTADGSPYTGPHTFNWKQGDSHTLAVTSPQEQPDGSRYRYLSWSDGGNQSHSYTVPTNDASVTVTFKQQFQLTVNSNSGHGNPQGAGWYDKGTLATFSVSTPVDNGSGTQYLLTTWTGSGSGSYNGSNKSNDVLMNNAITETASWTTQYYLDIENGGYGTTSGSGWYAPGSIQTFSISPTSDSVASTYKHDFTSWSGSGSGSYSGTSSPYTVTMNNPIIETANWQIQYYLTTSKNPDAGGDISPAPPGGWYNSGHQVTVLATPDTSGGYEFIGWNGDLTGTLNPTQINLNGPHKVTANFGGSVQITLKTNPLNQTFTVDGIDYTQTHVFTWLKGAKYAVSVAATQGESGGNRYAFGSWSDRGTRAHDYTVPASNDSLVVTLVQQHKLTVQSVYDTPSGDAWYNHGSNATFSVASTVAAGTGKQRLFTGWTGKGAGSYSGPDTTHSITVTAPDTEKAAWKTQYFLATSANPVNGGLITPAPPGTWCDSSATVSVSATAGAGNIWLGWSGDLTDSTQNPAPLVMSAPKSVTARFQVRIHVTVTTDPPGLTFTADDTTYTAPHLFGWAKTTTHTVSVSTPQAGGTGIRRAFVFWSDKGNQSHSYTVPAGDDTLKAMFMNQYLLTLNSESNRGNPAGADWYNSGASARFSADSLVAVSSDSRYRLTGWTSADPGGYSGKDASASVMMNGPVTETVQWKNEFFVTTICDPAWGGTLSPIPPPGAWAADTISITATGNVDSSYGFSNWTGSVTSSSNPLRLSVGAPKSLTAHFMKGKLRITSVPTGLEIVLDDTLHVKTPAVPIWLSGSKHKVAATDPQGDGVTTKYTFTTWSDGGAKTHGVTTPSETDTLTASFQTSYFVRVQSDHGTATGQGWYVQGTSAPFSVDSLVQAADSLRYRCLGWSENGAAAVTYPKTSIQLAVTKPLSEVARWMSQFLLGVATKPSNPALTAAHADPLGPWYDAASTVTLTAESRDTSYQFLRWDGSVSNTAVNPTSVVMDRAKTVTAVFRNIWNSPPHFNSSLKRSILENDTLRIPFADINAVVFDANDPKWTLVYTFSGSHVSTVIDSVRQEVRIVPDPHWNGTTTITMTVQDPYGETADGSIVLIVIPVDDSPGPVVLLTPPDDTKLEKWASQLKFSWLPSVNVDAGDTIRYYFYISSDINFKLELTTGQFCDTATETNIMPRIGLVQYWKVKAVDLGGQFTWSPVYHIDFEDAVESRRAPEDFALLQNYPNPFNPETIIRFQLPRSEQVLIEVVDMDGRVLNTLADARFAPGEHQVAWRGVNESGSPVGTGVYVVRMRAGSFHQMRKMMLLR